MRSFLRPLVALVTVAGSACSELTTADLERLAPLVSALDPVVASGATIALRLENGSRIDWAYRSCPARFEIRVSGEWEDVGTPLVACTALLTMIGAEETIEIQVDLPAGVPHGTYRAVVEFETDGHTVERPSNSFVVAEVVLAEGEKPEIQTLVATLPAGGALPLRITNWTSVQLGYNLCASGRLERREGDTWASLGEPLWLCTEELRLIAPGVSEESTYSILADVGAGTYRLRARFFSPTGAPIVTYSNSFEVQ